ncbi:MAG: HAMP domain-containing protein [Clostridia bacterium]|nr:HAMP domain-containing protein [Clostridia bacterium]
MYRSLYFKIILILIIFVTTVMTLVGAILMNGVSSYFADDFTSQMESAFSDDAELSGYLKTSLENNEGAEALEITLNAYSGILGLDDYRSAAVLDEDGTILAVSDASQMFVVGETVYLTENIVDVLGGGESGEGREQRTGAECFDFCVRITTDRGDSVLVYVRDTKEEMQNLNWMLFTIILQALLLGMLFAIILSFFLAKTITAPIQSLTRGAQQMAAGDFEQEMDADDVIDPHSRDEIGTLTDTFNHMKTVLKSTLDQVSGEQKKLETVFFYLKDAVIAFRDDGSVMHLNTTARDLFYGLLPENTDTADGKTAADTPLEQTLTLHGLLTLCGVEDTPRFRETLLDTLSANEEGYVIHEIALRERIFDVSLGNFRYMENNTGHAGIITVIHDVTGRYELDRSRREFVANVSHELRTPLTSIKGAAETVLRYPDMTPEMRESFLSMAVEEADRMTRIVGDLLVLSRLDNQRTKWEISTFRLGAVLARLCDVVHTDLDEHHHTLYRKFDDTLPEITADKDRIEQVFLNILSNAIKYTPDGGKIIVRGAANATHAAVSIRDNGIGVPKEDQPHLFERFYRVEKSRTTGAGGTGLGLAIAKELIEAHGGSIRLTSEVGRGTEITVILPLRSPLADEVNDDAAEDERPDSAVNAEHGDTV